MQEPSEKLSLERFRVRSPQLGVWTGCVIGTIVLVMIAMWALTGRSADDSTSLLLRIGLVYGLTSQGIWIASIIRLRPMRLVASSVVVIVGAALSGVQIIDHMQWEQYWEEFSYLGGMAISQSVVFFMFGVPAWQLGESGRAVGSSVVKPTRQFATLDIAFLTLATALVLACAMRQEPPIDSDSYWIVWVGIWALLPTIAALSSLSTAAASERRRLLSLLVAVVLTGFGCIGIVTREVNLWNYGPEITWLLVKMYGAFFLAFLGSVLAITHAGQWDQRQSTRHSENVAENAAGELDAVTIKMAAIHSSQSEQASERDR